jgi:hypothetical protein
LQRNRSVFAFAVGREPGVVEHHGDFVPQGDIHRRVGERRVEVLEFGRLGERLINPLLNPDRLGKHFAWR